MIKLGIFLFVLACIAATPLYVIIKKGFKNAKKNNDYEAQSDKYYAEPTLFIIDGKRMTGEDARIYYDYELSRHRRKNTLHLMIYDTKEMRYIYDDSASKYFDNILPGI